MTKDAQRPSAAMEGKGAYNRHSVIPSVGGALAWPHLQRAIAETPLGPSGSPIVVADYGSSQGLNSLAPIRLAVEAIEPAPASIARSSYIITISRRTISIRFSRSSIRAPIAIAAATRTSFPARSGGRFTKASCQRIRCTSAGALMRRCRSAASQRPSLAISSSPGPQARFAPHGSARGSRTGKPSCPSAGGNSSPAAASSSRRPAPMTAAAQCSIASWTTPTPNLRR